MSPFIWKYLGKKSYHQWVRKELTPRGGQSPWAVLLQDPPIPFLPCRDPLAALRWLAKTTPSTSLLKKLVQSDHLHDRILALEQVFIILYPHFFLSTAFLFAVFAHTCLVLFFSRVVLSISKATSNNSTCMILLQNPNPFSLWRMPPLSTLNFSS
jgi:hypothetical protein